MHLSGNLVSFLTVNFFKLAHELTKLQLAIQQLTVLAHSVDFI